MLIFYCLKEIAVRTSSLCKRSVLRLAKTSSILAACCCKNVCLSTVLNPQLYDILCHIINAEFKVLPPLLKVLRSLLFLLQRYEKKIIPPNILTKKLQYTATFFYLHLFAITLNPKIFPLPLAPKQRILGFVLTYPHSKYLWR